MANKINLIKYRNTGLDLVREEQELEGDEWVFGGQSPECLFFVPPDTREAYLPEGELQKGSDDFQDCVTRGYHNILETKFTFRYRRKMFKSENMVWLYDNSYVVNRNGQDFIEFSDRFIAILSGTTRQGNSMKAPAQAIHTYGLIPKTRLSKEEWMTWEEYHDVTKITPELKKLGAEFLKRFAVNYEQVFIQDLADLLKMDMANLAGYAWPKPKNGEYPKTEGPFGHAFMAFGLPKTYIFDNYIDKHDGDWIKKLAPDYAFYKYGYRVYISAEYTAQDRNAILKFIQTVKEILSGLFPPKSDDVKPETLPMNTESKLHATAVKWLGKDASPHDLVSDTVGCAESVSNIIREYNPKFPLATGTWTLWDNLKKSPYFKATLDPKPGVVIISPTSTGNGKIRNGHAGIFTGTMIASNDSTSGLWQENYTLEGWVKRYKNEGGFPVYMFEPL